MWVLDIRRHQKSLMETVYRPGPQLAEQHVARGETVIYRPHRRANTICDVSDGGRPPMLHGRVTGSIEDLISAELCRSSHTLILPVVYEHAN